MQASYFLMQEFYENLGRLRVAEALRQAQLTCLKDFPHPFFWAAYTLVGEGGGH